MEEIWKDVVGYEAQYMVSSTGRVKSKPRTLRFVSKRGNEAWRTTSEKTLALNTARHGYVLAHLQVGHVRKAHTVHALVMSAFVGPRPEGMEINHINGDKSDNRVLNLEYVTRSENKKHAVRIGLNRQARAVVADDAVVFPSITDAARSVGVTFGTIAAAIRNGSVCKGSTWRFA